MFCVQRSPIDRHGLFATQLIPQGTRIVEYIGEKITKEESAKRLAAYNAYIVHLNYRYDLDGSTLDNAARYINHSCAPNCAVDSTAEQIWIVAGRDIQAGEELCVNYGFDATDYTRFPCHCGAIQCCGYILGREYWGCIQPS